MLQNTEIESYASNAEHINVSKKKKVFSFCAIRFASI